MMIISHRGYWKNKKEKNTSLAFERSFSLGFGTETDIRDYKGKLVISHDIADEKCLSLDTFFKIYNKYSQKNKNMILALNIKSDGLHTILDKKLKKYGIKNYFVFDMSVPEQMQYIKKRYRTATRKSEIEKTPPLYDKSEFVWIDSFYSDWITNEELKYHINNNKKIGIISPELHKRNHTDFWNHLLKMKSIKEDKENKIILCTDLPEDARGIFYGKN